MPEEVLLVKEQPSLPPSDEWIPLIDASRILGLKSIRQVYRRIQKHQIQHKRVVTGTRVRSFVRREDVEKSRKLAFEEAYISDMSDELSDLTSVRRQSDIGHDVTRSVIPLVKDFISTTGNKLEHLEHVRSLVTDLLNLAREEREDRKKERGAILRAKEQERRTNLVRLICYLIATVAFCGFVGYTTWWIYSGRLFSW